MGFWEFGYYLGHPPRRIEIRVIRNLFLKIIFLPQLSIVYETIKQSHQFTTLDLIIEFVRSKRLYL